MNSFYSKLYDPIKDRRYGMLFLITVVIFFCLSAIAMLVHGILDRLEMEESGLRDYFLRVWPGIVILIGVLVWRKLRRNQRQQKETFQRHEWSREEIRKARSKLVKTKN